MTITITRKQRLQTLENQICKNYEAFVATGRALKEIRDDELYRENGHDTWESYLKNRVAEEFGIESTHARRLIQAAAIRPKLPNLRPRAVDNSVQWSQRAVLEFARLAPNDESASGHPKDISSLRKQDVTRVANEAIKIAKEQNKPLNSAIVRQAVDNDLGVDRSKKARKTKSKQNNGIDLDHYIKSKIGQIEAITEHLAVVPASAWTLLDDRDPGLAKRLAEVCDELAGLLRS